MSTPSPERGYSRSRAAPAPRPATRRSGSMLALDGVAGDCDPHVAPAPGALSERRQGDESWGAAVRGHLCCAVPGSPEQLVTTWCAVP